MKMLILIISSTLLVGCGHREWILRHEPTTDAERKAITEHVEKILSATPKTLSGHDQDWDDAILAAHREAENTLCRPTMWEYINGGMFGPFSGFTGRWKYTEQVTNRVEAP